jgi:hypothetical protein
MNETIASLKQRLNEVYRQIDQIVQAGGKVELGHPLTREAQMLRTKIQELVLQHQE